MRNLGPIQSMLLGFLIHLGAGSALASMPIEKSHFVDMNLSWGQSEPVLPAKVLTSLQKLYEADEQKDHAACVRAAANAWTAAPKVRTWVLTLWLKCARKADENDKVTRAMLTPLHNADVNPELFATGAGRSLLWTERINAEMSAGELLWKSTPKQTDAALAHWNHLLSFGDHVDRETRSRLYVSLAELAQMDHSLPKAKQFLEQSLTEKANKTARERLGAIQLALQVPTETTENSSTAPAETPDLVKTTEANVPEVERRVEERLEQSQSAKDYITYLEDAVTYLAQFPNGRKARSTQERILDIEQQITDRANSGNDLDPLKYQELRLQALNVMKKLDSARLFELAKAMHRRADYFGALVLLQTASADFYKTPLAGQALWMQGRSAQVLGRYNEAQLAFEHYVLIASGGEELAEVLFRLALVQFRQKHFPSCVATLEKLLVLPGGDRYELGARYWLVRSLEQEGSPRALTEAHTLITKFPLSYYGLRLISENQGGILRRPLLPGLEDPPILKQSLAWTLAASQKEIWDRAVTLAQGGWKVEAQRELSELTWPHSPDQKLAIAHRLAELGIYPVALRLAAEATDSEPSFRNLAVLSFAFPDPYAESLKHLGTKNSLNPWLLKSLIRQESAYGTHALSTSNALGLMQLIPPTAQEVAQEMKLSKISIPEDVFSPEINLEMGTFYLAKMIRQFKGCVPMGVAAYNVGPVKMQIFVNSRPEVANLIDHPSSVAADEIWFDELPWSETSYYVKAVLRNYFLYRTLEQGEWKMTQVLWSDLAVRPAENTGKENSPVTAHQ